MNIQVCRGLFAVVAITCDSLVTPSNVIIDLRDANESTWAFVAVDDVDCTEKRQVIAFVTMANGEPSLSYCGRIAVV
jgi:hypothetical protein